MQKFTGSQKQLNKLVTLLDKLEAVIKEMQKTIDGMEVG